MADMVLDEAIVNEARSHLKAVLIQAIPSDDSIIIEHVREAYRLLTPKHIHKAKYSEDGKLLDQCARCGHDLRDTDFHLTAIL
jgi:hypothetical protein